MKRVLTLLLLLLVPRLACAAEQTDTKEIQIEYDLQVLRNDLDKAQALWEQAIDDALSDELLKKSYEKLQDRCRELYRRKGKFATARQKELCEITQYPFEMYQNDLIIKVNNLRKQLFEIETAGTVANDYYLRPSKSNLEKLKIIFDRVNKYYVGSPYTWNRYYHKYLFSRSRLTHARVIWKDRLAEYRQARQSAPGGTQAERVRKRAEAAFHKLKEETKTNNLPFAGEVNAFYLAKDLEDYLRREQEAEKRAVLRLQAGRKKEIVIFIHGLGEDRDSWKAFPELLATEDMADPSMDRYFLVYVFRFDTVEDSKTVEGFRRELDGFIKDILAAEKADHVNLVGHSLGGVISLQYMVQYAAGRVDEKAPPKFLLHGYLDGKLRHPVARFVGIAPSLSGSEVANIMANIFKKDPPLYERSLGPFQSGIPIAGDLQVLENQIGSRVNINSFTKLDFERPLDPYRLLDFLSDEDRQNFNARQMESLHAMGVKTLSIIGKQPIVIPIFAGPEEDGLVKCYSANVNHIFMADGNAQEDIGYKDAQVRFANIGHMQLIEVNDRRHPSYAYVASFLKDKLMPPLDAGAQKARHFICMLRVYPSDQVIEENPDFCFFPEEKVYFKGDQRLDLPKLDIRVIAGRGGSFNARIDKASWNPFTGVHYLEGYQENTEEPAAITLEMRADGFIPKTVTVPVSGGLVSYAVRLQLQKSK